MFRTLALLLTLLFTSNSYAMVNITNESKLIKHFSIKYKKDSSYVKTIISKVKLEAAKYKIDPYLVLAVIEHESSFNAKAKNGSSTGLMQINLKAPLNKKLLRNRDPYSIDTNINVGVEVLRFCRDVDKRPMLVCYRGSDNGYSKKVASTASKLKRI